MEQEKKNKGQLWKAVLSVSMVIAGCCCFMLSCIAALVVAGRKD